MECAKCFETFLRKCKKELTVDDLLPKLVQSL
jgi:hypothetical protein